MLKSSGRRLDIATPFVDAMLPDGHRLHVVLDGITRGFSAVNIRKFVAAGAPPRRPRRARQPHRRRRRAFLEACVVAGLNIVVAGGTQAGKTTMLNCLAAAIPGGERIVTRRGGLRAALPPPRLGGHADPPGRARGHRRDHPAPPRQGVAAHAARSASSSARCVQAECLDLLLASTAACPAWHRARQLRPRGAGQALHAAAAGGREHLARASWSRRSPRASTSSCTSASTPTGDAASARSSRCPVGSRPTSSRPSRSSCRRRRSSSHGPTACRRGSSGSQRAASTSTAALVGRAAVPDDGRARSGSASASGCCLCWSAATPSRSEPDRRAPTRPRQSLAAARRRPASADVTPRSVVLVWRGRFASASCRAGRVAHRSGRRACSRLIGGYAPDRRAAPARGPAPSRAAPRYGRRRSTTWPSAVRAGLSLPEALTAARRPRARARCGRPSPRSAATTRPPAGSATCLDRLKDGLADPVGDRVVEGLRIAREVGGGDLGRMLRDAVRFLRDDARTRSELEARQAWIVNGARLAVGGAVGRAAAAVDPDAR